MLLQRSSSIFRKLGKNFVLSHPVRQALENDAPVVALESTIITHGMPYPVNLKTAMSVENIIKNKGVVPATIAVIEGKIHVGLEEGMLHELANTNENIVKVSRRDLPYVIAKKLSGGTTVAGTMMIAHQCKIPIFVTGGIGGVHREGHETLDISADLAELGRTPVAVICAGVKSILDIGRTLEYLETQGVPVATICSSHDDNAKFPSFFSSKSSFQSPMTIATPKEAANLVEANLKFNQSNGVLLAVPIPHEFSIDSDQIDETIEIALEECKSKGIKGKAITPFVLDKVNCLTKGRSLEANVALIENNARVGAEVANHLSTSSYDLMPFHNCQQAKRPVVIGGTNFDIVCKAANLEQNSSTIKGNIRTCFGGVGRSLAQALWYLNCNPYFISAVGDDHLGQSMLNSALDTSLIEKVAESSTAIYCLTLTSNGDLFNGVGDMDIHTRVTPQRIHQCRQYISNASMVALDANFSQETVDAVLQICCEENIPVFFEPTDPAKAQKAIKSPWSKAITYTSPNLDELKMMVNEDNDDESPQVLGQLLKQKLIGSKAIIVTLGKDGVLLITDDSTRHFPSKTEDNVVSVSGAGDCLSAGFMAGILHGHDEQTALCMGLNAAKLSLFSTHAVPENLSLENISEEN